MNRGKKVEFFMAKRARGWPYETHVLRRHSLNIVYGVENPILGLVKERVFFFRPRAVGMDDRVWWIERKRTGLGGEILAVSLSWNNKVVLRP